jgi:hypothetical protein
MTGAIDVTVTGGLAPFCYDWAHLGGTCPGSSDPQDVTGLGAGTYTVTVTDDNGCTDILSITITEPAPLSLMTIESGLACNGGPTGSIALIVSGGVPPDTVINGPMDTSFFYFYDWDWDGTMTNDVFDADLNGMDDEDLSNLYAGLYTVTVTDVNGCTASATAQVDSFLSPMIITAPDTIALLCFGDLTTIDITVTGGFPTPPNFYDYAWDQDGIFNDPEDLVGVGAGTYIVAVTEPVSGCLSYDTIVVIEPPDLTISVSTTDAQCNDMPVGSYVITVSGGTPLYDYNDGTKRLCPSPPPQ